MELDVFRTSTLQIAAFVASGTELLRCESIGRGRCEFLFRDPQGQVAKLASQYFSGAPASALRFTEQSLNCVAH